LKYFLNIIIGSVLAVAGLAQPAPRTVTKINSNWLFAKGDSTERTAWKNVDIPHTWNIEDVADDIPGYYRGISWYKKKIVIPKELKNKSVSLYFEGVNQEATVFINGIKAGEHIGGYNGFSISVSDLLKYGVVNTIAIKVDNSFNADIPPLTADFTFYGGIYRDVFLVTASKIHFSGKDNGSKGVYISTPGVTKEKAEITVRSILENASPEKQHIRLVTTIYDRQNKKIIEKISERELGNNTNEVIEQSLPSIDNPHLWSPEDPYLYKVVSSIYDTRGYLLDRISNAYGFRWFSFDPEKGFYLNGQPYKLIGASRHQDYKGLGNAVPDALAIEDVRLLKRMGANFLRVAHYPQDPSVMDACDSLGLITSVEIPVVNEITESDAFYKNCEAMQVEMIRQNYNHPSVIIWCYMNEILLKPHYSNEPARKAGYYANIRQLAQKLEDITKKEDPYRYTMMANHGNLEQYRAAGLLDIPKLIGWNLYSGWYGGSMDDFPNFLDQFHAAYTKRTFLVTEYGADADPRIRSTKPVRFDKSVEYTTRFHQFYLTEMMKRPYVAAAIVWNLADFSSETRTETMPHMNNKGLLEFDRTPKDPYYYYKAILSRKPFIKILGSNKIFGIADSSSQVCYQILEVASNLDSLSLILNGVPQPNAKVINGIAQWKLPFKVGVNAIVAKGNKDKRTYMDTRESRANLLPHCLKDNQIQFRQMNVVLGTSRYYVDEDGNWWQPDQPYEQGEWGYVGGTAYKIKNNNRLPYGTDKNIIGTVDDPIYQTQQTGIRQYKLDVPPGEYQVKLHFAELSGGGKIAVPPYNLTDTSRTESKGRRVFNVSLNGKILLQNFNIAEEYGVVTPVIKTTTVRVEGDNGIVIDFEPVEGEPVLNALQVKKL